jgi:hypothetical protein
MQFLPSPTNRGRGKCKSCRRPLLPPSSCLPPPPARALSSITTPSVPSSSAATPSLPSICCRRRPLSPLLPPAGSSCCAAGSSFSSAGLSYSATGLSCSVVDWICSALTPLPPLLPPSSRYAPPSRFLRRTAPPCAAPPRVTHPTPSPFAFEERGSGFLHVLSPLRHFAFPVCLICWSCLA